MGSAATAGLKLRMRLLGELELRRGDGPALPLPPSRRTRALLGYLAATGVPQSRATLCDLLWDGPDDPRAALRWSLTKLRAVVNDDVLQPLQADRDKVSFDAGLCEIDGVHIATLAAGDLNELPLATLEQVAQLLQGEFLDGVELPACYRFHHWCMAERERFARLRRAALQALVQRLVDDPQRALPHGRAMVAADPLADNAHAALVRLLAAAGRYPEAERHYSWARELLRREVSLPDGGVLDEAIRAVRRQQRQAAVPAVAEDAAAPQPQPGAPASAGLATVSSAIAGSANTSSANTSPANTSPAKPGASAGSKSSVWDLARPPAQAPAALVGRDDERQAIDQALADPGRSSLLLFIGEPGIGKTRLLDHLAERATAQGWRLLRARCFEAEAVRPYGFWLDALRGLPTAGIDAGLLAQAAPLLARDGKAEAGSQADDIARPPAKGFENPERARSFQDGPPAASREQLFEAAAALLHQLAQQQPLAVVVDDMQWIDAASAALLHFVARRLADSRLPMLLAAAARAGEIDDNAGAQGLLASLAREGALQQHDLLPLQANHVRQWLGERLADVDEALRASGGNPLMLTELARVAGSASAAGSGSAAATSRPLDSLVHDRLRGFDDASRDLLGWAAALGGAFDADRLAAATALPMAELLSRLAQFERRGLLHATGDGSFDFCHGLVRQAIYRGLSTPRRKALHRQIARALDEATADDPWLHGSVVHHASLAGDARLATRAALSAGQHWLRVFANVEAAQVAERGLALLEELPPGAERSRLDIGLLRLRMAAASVPGGRRLPDLSQRITQATHAALALGLHADAAAAWELLAYWRQQSGDAAGAREASLAAERCTRRSDDITRCQQLANTGRCLVNIEADGDQGRQLLGEAEALATELQLPVMELEWGRGLLARADGDLATAREALSNAVAMAQAAANHWREYECMLALATTEYELGLADEVLRHAAEVAAAARRMGEAEVPFADALAALTRWRRGELEVAEIVRTSLAALRERDDKANLSYTLNEAAMLLLAAGDAAQASRYAEEALAAAAAVRRPTQIARARATLAAAAASPAQAS